MKKTYNIVIQAINNKDPLTHRVTMDQEQLEEFVGTLQSLKELTYLQIGLSFYNPENIVYVSIEG